MKKEFHGFKLEKVDLPMNNIITASGSRCNFTYNYCEAPHGSDSWQICDYDTASSIKTKPYYYESAS